MEREEMRVLTGVVYTIKKQRTENGALGDATGGGVWTRKCYYI